MLDKHTRGAVWLGFVFLTNVGLVAYLQTYQNAAGRFLFGLPEAFVVLVLFVFVVTGANAAFAWYYLGKPNVSDVFNPDGRANPDDGTAEVSEPKQTGDA